MKKCHLISVVAISLLMISSPMVFAQTPTHVEFNFSGSGNLMVSPVHYSGSITAGEPLLVGGYWNIWIDDTGWPPDTDKLARWFYIEATYFTPNYDPILGTWTAVFDEHTTASSPAWNAGHTLGELTGTATIQFSLADFDFDAVVDADERAFAVFSGTLIVVKDGTGIWAGYCGLGSFSGSSFNPDPANWADDTADGFTILDIEDCGVPTDEVTWGQVKQLYK